MIRSSLIYKDNSGPDPKRIQNFSAQTPPSQPNVGSPGLSQEVPYPFTEAQAEKGGCRLCPLRDGLWEVPLMWCVKSLGYHPKTWYHPLKCIQPPFSSWLRAPGLKEGVAE